MLSIQQKLEKVPDRKADKDFESGIVKKIEWHLKKYNSITLN